MDRRHFGAAVGFGTLGLLGWVSLRRPQWLAGQGNPEPGLEYPRDGKPLNFLTMWRACRPDPEVEGTPLNHAIGDHYGPVQSGDTVWLVSIRAGRLELVGRIVVGEITDQAGAERALGTTELNLARYHLLAATGTVRASILRDIHSLAPQLRFADHGGVADSLVISPDGTIDATQLMPLRLLTTDSAQLLEQELGKGGNLAR